MHSIATILPMSRGPTLALRCTSCRGYNSSPSNSTWDQQSLPPYYAFAETVDNLLFLAKARSVRSTCALRRLPPLTPSTSPGFPLQMSWNPFITSETLRAEWENYHYAANRLPDWVSYMTTSMAKIGTTPRGVSALQADVAGNFTRRAPTATAEAIGYQYAAGSFPFTNKTYLVPVFDIHPLNYLTTDPKVASQMDNWGAVFYDLSTNNERANTLQQAVSTGACSTTSVRKRLSISEAGSRGLLLSIHWTGRRQSMLGNPASFPTRAGGSSTLTGLDGFSAALLASRFALRRARHTGEATGTCLPLHPAVPRAGAGCLPETTRRHHLLPGL